MTKSLSTVGATRTAKASGAGMLVTMSRSGKSSDHSHLVEEREPREPSASGGSPTSALGSESASPMSSGSGAPEERHRPRHNRRQHQHQQTRFCFYQPIEMAPSHILPTPRNDEASFHVDGVGFASNNIGASEGTIENGAIIVSSGGRILSPSSSTADGDNNPSTGDIVGGVGLGIGTNPGLGAANLASAGNLTNSNGIIFDLANGSGISNADNITRFNFYSTSISDSQLGRGDDVNQEGVHDDDDDYCDACSTESGQDCDKYNGPYATRIGTATASDELDVLEVEAELLSGSAVSSQSKIRANGDSAINDSGIDSDGKTLLCLPAHDNPIPELTPSEDSTDEILRSLQETEEQCVQLRLEAKAAHDEIIELKRHGPSGIGGGRLRRDDNGSTRKKKNRSALLIGSRRVSNSDIPPPSNATPVTQATGQTSNVPVSFGNSRLSSDARMPLGSDIVGQKSDEDGGNPYEDAIKEALDLLRRHRTPSESRPPQSQTEVEQLSVFTPSVGSRLSNTAFKLQTPREMDRLLYHRGDGNDDDSTPFEDIDGQVVLGVSTSASIEDRKLKAKERQVRMANYATRLQEFKSSIQTEDEPWRRRMVSGSSALSSEYPVGPLSQVRTCDESVGVSDLSLSTKAHDEEVQRGVERVLLAILERASTSRSRASEGRANIIASQSSRDEQDAGAEYQDSSNALIRAMDTLLRQPSDMESIVSVPDLIKPEHPIQDRSDRSNAGNSGTQSGKSSKRSIERSVVDDLLAEEDDPVVLSRECPTLSHAVGHTGSLMWSSSIQEEEKLSETFRECMLEVVPDADGNGIEAQEGIPSADLSDLIDSCLKSSSPGPSSGSSGESDESDDDEDGEDGEDVEDESSHSDQVQRSFENDIDDSVDGNRNSPFADQAYEDNSNSGSGEDGLERVLGPLSKKAGGTTGVVLDLVNVNDGRSLLDNPALSVIGSFSAVIKDAESIMSYVASAMSPNQSKDGQLSINDGDSIDELGIDIDEDPEATELMRTLCAHLLPFGVDQSNRLLDAIPAWDEENINEAGYRIIRLTKMQLRRVERAFKVMVNGLKRDSERHLKELDNSNSGYDNYDANFVRELQEAEKLLDDEERRLNAVKKSRNIGRMGVASHESGSSRVGLKGQGLPSHPQFPGLKSAGMGDMGDLEYFNLPIIYKSHVTGFEPTKDLILEPGNVVAGQYLVESELGSAAFSTAYRCVDLSSDEDSEDGQEEVCLKVIKNTKDFFDQSLDEIKILELLRQTGQCYENNIVEMKTFFYHREHLVIVTELLRQNLFEFGKFIVDNDEEPYFTIPRLAYITRQALIALQFVHSLGLVHSDVKPENILLSSYSRARVKLIDFGSSCYLTDRQSSYIQSRSYRAPEVVLGLPYDGRIDIWSLGCVVAEMFTNEVTFQNDSIVSMLSRIEAICGPFPRHMIAQGRQSGQFFTKSGLLYEVVGGSDDEGKDPLQMRFDDESDSDTDFNTQYDIFQPKSTCLSARLGFSETLMDGFCAPKHCSYHSVTEKQEQAMFTDFVGNLLTIDSDSRPTASEALNHPWMRYAESLTEDDIRYPSSS